MKKEKLIFFWENFGPMHLDRCEAVARALGEHRKVVGLELTSKSNTYDWDAKSDSATEKQLVFPHGAPSSQVKRFFGLWRTIRKIGKGKYFLCHYNRLDVLICAIILRATGSKVFLMSCSKFDDKPRKAWIELSKTLFTLPYHGAISSGERPADYLRFLGIRAHMIMTEYNTLSISRIRKMSGTVPAPAGLSFGNRNFIVVARLVPKKNLSMLIDAYVLYSELTENPRRLDICGSGPLEAELLEKIERCGVSQKIKLHGFLQTEEISVLLGQSVALILPSVEEQFGNVVIEAQALGLPVLLSDKCGARDKLVRSGVNGFVFEPDNPRGLAYFMSLISKDESLWRQMCGEATESAQFGDVACFASAVRELDEKTAV